MQELLGPPLTRGEIIGALILVALGLFGIGLAIYRTKKTGAWW